jgi:thiopeptide-type bacteriocin biosynthesis protein
MALVPAGFFALRTPLLPFATLTAWSDGLCAPAAADGALDGAIAADVRLLRERLFALISRPEIREALFVASPSLDERLADWQAHPERGEKVERVVVRYLARMAGRPTPFGLFAGCSVGTIGRETRLLLARGATRHTRLDSDYLARLAEVIGRDPAGRRASTYRPNSSLYRAAGRLRYAEASSGENGRAYHLVAVEPTEYLDATLARAASGARFDELAAALVDDEIARDEAEQFVDELIDSQILVSDLHPQVTGREPIHDLVEQLARAPATAPTAAALDRARIALADLDAGPLGASPSVYRAIAAALREPIEIARLFQVDLVKRSPDATLGDAVVSELARGVELLRRISPRPRETALSRFRDAFAERYQGREVPLVEALDDELGIGFDRSATPPTPLLDGLAFGGAEPAPDAPWTPLGTLLLRHLEEALRRGDHRISLDEADLASIASADLPPLPGSLAVMASIASRAGGLDIWIQAVSGPSGANLLGRFCHGDARLAAEVARHLRAEEAQRPGAIFAEIVHLPQGRTGNVLLRPVLRDHEIAYLGRSGAPAERQLAITDLTVAVESGRVVLRTRDGREVLPRLTTAHNFTGPDNLAIYRFLCALPHQDSAPLGFSWGPLDRASFLPRVCVGSLVLSLARWRIEGPDLRALGEARGAERYRRVRELRKRLSLPRWIALADGDNVLPVDLDNALAVDAFVQIAKERTSAILTELFDPDPSLARGPDGAYVHEVVVPFLSDAPPREAAKPRPARAVPRRFAPGGEWLYAKLYGGAASADRVLSNAIAPVIRGAIASGAADTWFFLRYGDPEWHLRVRLRGDPRRLHAEVLPALAEAAQASLDAGDLFRFQLDTYEREVERYGGAEGIALVEQIFCADSDACLALLPDLTGDAGADARWRLALRGFDLLLSDLGFDLPARRAIVRAARQAFAAELRVGAETERRLADRFRAERRALEQALGPGIAALDDRSRRLRPIAAELRAREAAGLLDAPLAAIAPSLLHMHANRMLRAGAARHQEFVLHYLLDRLYEGMLARKAK